MRLPASIIALGLLATLPSACVDLARPPHLTTVVTQDGAAPDTARDTAAPPRMDTAPPAPDTALVVDQRGDREDPDVPMIDPEIGAEVGPPADAPQDIPVPPPVPDAPAADKPDGTGAAANGTACTVAGACLSGSCVDGVCCENACNGPCSACNLSGTRGLCRLIPAGNDPDNECPASLVTTCGLDGACNGAGACRLHVAGTTCVPGSCSGSTAVGAATCDGGGHCGMGSIHECAPYLCGGGICQTTCTVGTDCKAGYICSGMACVPAMSMSDAGAPDAAPPGAVLLVDDFSDVTLTRNTMGGAVTWDNQTVMLLSGGVRFAWNGQSDYNDFIETFLQSFCAYDIRAYRTLRFRMSASAGPRTVRIFLPRSNNTCATAATPLLGTVNVTTTMTTFDVDLSASVRDKALFIEFSPVTQDATTYLLDDVQLIQ